MRFMNNSKFPWKLLIIALLAIAVAGVAGKFAFGWLTEEAPEVSMEEARKMVRERQQAEAAPLAVPNAPAQITAAKTESLESTAPVALPVSNGSVGKLTETLSKVEVARAELTLAKLEKEISAIAPVSIPSAVQMPAFIESAPIAATAPQVQFRPAIISIEGFDDQIYAILSSPNGRQRVKKGDRLTDGGRVENITASAVTIKTRSGASLNLAFED
ncbi:MAG: type IV pilus biogenesis protein PilP [Deltaproteobacteria bacterium]|jgi:type IV pilus biogenesis protein PilP|nr:type IV pilus biogenesis protein PilP [Deltaproteobacteria bacterium]